MPQRFLRPSITNSERWNSVSWQAQSLFIRVLTLVDDFGQYDARPAVLWGQCFQIWNTSNPDQAVELQQVALMLQQLAAADLIELYEAEGKKFLQVTQWKERIRDGCKRKYPNPEKLQQVAASCSVLLPPSSPSPPSSPPSPSPLLSGKPDDSKADKVELLTKARIALHWLNQKAGRNFRETGPNLQAIAKRITEVNDLEGIKKMIDRQCLLWRATQYAEYLQPSTLFKTEKFNEYYDKRDLPIPTATSNDKPNPRNAGTCASVTDYAAAGRRKLERQEAERRQSEMGSQVAQDENAPRTIASNGQ